jgi:PIN domain nuclease of toxin-antitoxin system
MYCCGGGLKRNNSRVVPSELSSIRENRSYVSAAVAWELAIKVNLGKHDARDVVSNLKQFVD